MNGLTRVFLILLRLAIGWHFLFEGIEKIHSVDMVGRTETNRPWSSIDYLREATGPAADFFHRQVGDPDGEALALFAVKPLEKGQDASRVPARQRISPALEQAWNEYLDRFERHYQLTEEQKTLAQSRMDQAKDQAVRWLLGEQQKGGRDSTLVVEKSFNGAAVVKVKETSRQRIDAYRANVEDLRRIMNEKLPAFGRDVEKQKIAPLKGETNRQRTELLAELEKPMEESLASVLTEEQKKLGSMDVPHTGSIQDWKQWDKLDWINGLTRYGITAIGACLLLGLFTRTACLGGALFLLMVYLAMPALPWLPENPRAEGHYLYVNKNIIEMLALLALATTRSGRWFGLDGLLHALAPWRWRRAIRDEAAGAPRPSSYRQ